MSLLGWFDSGNQVKACASKGLTKQHPRSWFQRQLLVRCQFREAWKQLISLLGNAWNKWIQSKDSDFELMQPTDSRKGAAMALVPFVVTEAAHI